MVGGKKISKLAEEAGTPFYAYDCRLIADRVKKVRTHCPKGVQLLYAVKANPIPELVQYMSGLVDGFETASIGEMQNALKTGIKPGRVFFTGPAKTPEDIRAAIVDGVTLIAESLSQISHAVNVVNAAKELGVTPKIGLRINPPFDLRGAGAKTGGVARPFGMDPESVPAAIDMLKRQKIALAGLHFFPGSQCLDSAAIVKTHNQIYELCSDLLRRYGQPVDFINLGGGFGIPYFEGEKEIDLRPIGDSLEKISKRAADDFSATLILELGRYLVGPAGVYVCRVIDRKISGGKTFLVTDGGMHHHLAASGNFGQVIRKNFRVCLGQKIGEQRAEMQSIVGPLCTALDIIADQVPLPPGEIGDLIAVFQSGAYGLTASPVHFHSRPLPKELLV